MPTVAQLAQMELLVFYNGQAIELSIDEVKISYNFSYPCPEDNCNSHAPHCKPEVIAQQANLLAKIKEKAVDYTANNIKLPNALHRVRFCAGQEYYLIQEELEIIKEQAGNYQILQSIPFQKTDEPVPTAEVQPTDYYDLFSEQINYYNGRNILDAPGNQNGNISWVKWKVAGQTTKAYGYQYDVMNRLTKATFSEFLGKGPDGGQVYTTDDRYGVSGISYDLQGNIQFLQRKGAYKSNPNANCWDFGVIDALIYGYNPANANELIGVGDIVGSTDAGKEGHVADNTSGEQTFQYDTAGNLEVDNNKNANISYNTLGLPYYIQTDEGEIKWMYDAGGNVLSMAVTTAEGSYTKYYVAGVEYTGIDGGTPRLEAIYHEEGRVLPEEEHTGGNYTGDFRHEYVLTDHLGNARVTFSDLNGNGVVELGENSEIVQENHYYPFGMNQKGPWNAAAPVRNNYQYNGIEHIQDLGLNVNFAFYRTLDPSLGRWWQVDPEAESFYGMTPYNSMGNNPVSIVDPEGDFWHIVIGAAIGGVFNVATHWNKLGTTGRSWWADFGIAFGIGAASGALSGGVGGATSASLGLQATGFISGAVAGGAGSALGSPVMGIGNAIAFGDEFDLKTWGRDIIAGAFFGEIAGGVSAKLKGRNFWNGQYDLDEGLFKHVQSQMGNSLDDVGVISEWRADRSLWELPNLERGEAFEELAQKYTYTKFNGWEDANKVLEKYNKGFDLINKNTNEILSIKSANGNRIQGRVFKNIETIAKIGKSKGFKPILQIFHPVGHHFKNQNRLIEKGLKLGVEVIFTGK